MHFNISASVYPVHSIRPATEPSPSMVHKTANYREQVAGQNVLAGRAPSEHRARSASCIFTDAFCPPRRQAQVGSFIPDPGHTWHCSDMALLPPVSSTSTRASPLPSTSSRVRCTLPATVPPNAVHRRAEKPSVLLDPIQPVHAASGASWINLLDF